MVPTDAVEFDGYAPIWKREVELGYESATFVEDPILKHGERQPVLGAQSSGASARGAEGYPLLAVPLVERRP